MMEKQVEKHMAVGSTVYAISPQLQSPRFQVLGFRV